MHPTNSWKLVLTWSTPSNREVIHIIFSRDKLCRRIFIHIRYSSCPEICSVKINGLYDKRGRPHQDQNLSRMAVLNQADGANRRSKKQNSCKLGHFEPSHAPNPWMLSPSMHKSLEFPAFGACTTPLEIEACGTFARTKVPGTSRPNSLQITVSLHAQDHCKLHHFEPLSLACKKSLQSTQHFEPVHALDPGKYNTSSPCIPKIYSA